MKKIMDSKSSCEFSNSNILNCIVSASNLQYKKWIGKVCAGRNKEWHDYICQRGTWNREQVFGGSRAYSSNNEAKQAEHFYLIVFVCLLVCLFARSFVCFSTYMESCCSALLFFFSSFFFLLFWPPKVSSFGVPLFLDQVPPSFLLP